MSSLGVHLDITLGLKVTTSELFSFSSQTSLPVPSRRHQDSKKSFSESSEASKIKQFLVLKPRAFSLRTHVVLSMPYL